MSPPLQQLPSAPTALLRQPNGDGWWLFDRVRETLRADQLADVRGTMAAAEAATEQGAWAVGFLAYEAAPAFDPALDTHPPVPGLPLAWFAFCEAPTRLADDEIPSPTPFTVADLATTLSATEHRHGVERIHAWIGRGDTYQVNYTHQFQGRLEGDPWGLFRALERSQSSDFAAWLDLGDQVICSASPELFFSLDGDHLVARPMKGTATRGRNTAEDQQQQDALTHSPKDRAENVMIVDMIRNDLGRVARPGSVQTTQLFDVESYATVFQMTSTVEARTEASVADVVAALFPCASITGAPKVRTSELIRKLETGPRGVYTGALGWLAPGRRARFSVAIRTATHDRRHSDIRYGTGGGIVWDSAAAAEYDECVVKTRILTQPRPEFELLETLLWRPAEGYDLLDRHLERLTDSARYFDFPRPPASTLRTQLDRAVSERSTAQRVRLLLGRDGGLRIEAEPLRHASATQLNVALASRPVDSSDPFLFHKTTHRRVYEEARGDRTDIDDVVLWNERGELTETTIANLVLEIDGGLVTPPVRCGLLAGTYRAALLSQGAISERVLTRDDLTTSTAVYLVNSVRGRVPATVLP